MGSVRRAWRPGTIEGWPSPVNEASSSDDPEYYLTHDVYKDYNIYGCPYLDAECLLPVLSVCTETSGHLSTGYKEIDMNITVYYQSGRIDSFSTENFCAQEPFKSEGTNITTEFQLRLDLLYEEGLLLEVFWYDANISNSSVSSKNDEVGIKIPHASRMRGRRVRLVSHRELADIAKIVCDGELLVWRQGSELINGIKFFGQELLCFSDATTTSINRRALNIFEYLKNANPGLPGENIAKMMGYSKDAIDTIKADETANEEDRLPDEIEDEDSILDEET